MTAIRLIIVSWCIIIGLGFLLWSQMNAIIYHVLPVNRWAAGIFLLLTVIWFVVEFGWLGGNKTKTSHM